MSAPTFNRPHGPITLAELTDGLVWPRLLRALILSLRPQRLVLGTLGVALMLGVAGLLTVLTEAERDGVRPSGIGERLLADLGDGVGGAAASAVRFDFDEAWRSIDLTRTAFSVHSERWGMLVLSCAVLLPVWLVLGGAISRSAALEFAGGPDTTLARSLVFSVRRLGVMLRAVLLPLALAAVISLGLKASGWALFSLPGVSVIGAVLYPLMVLAGLVFALIWVGFVIGQWLLVPAIAVENTDATDAVQRSFSYVLGRPARTLAYFAIAAAGFAVGLVLVQWLVSTSEGLARAGSSAWLTPERATLVLTPARSSGLSASLLDGWAWLIGCVAAGWAVSYLFTASTLLYLLLRRVHDEQDPSEVWVPPGASSSRA